MVVVGLWWWWLLVVVVGDGGGGGGGGIADESFVAVFCRCMFLVYSYQETKNNF